ncbi:substrate-binding domain-containing protein [Calorimonas adulescens]|uniref:Tungsten ABC transporter substrate-binding protein n=1 Tax=Calorimonas adulescens TaxID=2606906 RepID=A0A5D8Q9R0_9THEO|nr:tungsten ABC transporter substrate-binding protein [Calorimonas adulescens]
MIVSGCGSTVADKNAGEGQVDSRTKSNTEKPLPENSEVILSTTTSTQDSGLLDVLIPLFEEKTGYKVKTIAVGTGQALAMGENGDADVMLVHAPASEIEVVNKGAAMNRQLVMHNDFIIVGPKDDPAGIKGLNAQNAFKKIAENQSLFISRGDDSGTNKKEMDIWEAINIKPSGGWYQEVGQGMGATLDIASEKQGYTLTDRATYLAKKSTLSLDILSEGSPELLNIYHVMQVNPDYVAKTSQDKAKMINVKGAKAFVDFMISPETQKIIGDFGKKEYGEPLFFPDAGKDENSLSS